MTSAADSRRKDMTSHQMWDLPQLSTTSGEVHVANHQHLIIARAVAKPKIMINSALTQSVGPMQKAPTLPQRINDRPLERGLVVARRAAFCPCHKGNCRRDDLARVAP